MSTTIRVSEKTRDRLAKLATVTGRPMTSLLEDAAEALEKQLFFAEFSKRYSELSEDPNAWAEIEEERRIEGTPVRDCSN